MDSKISKLKRKKESSYANSQYDSTYRHCIELAELLVESENYEEALMEYKEAEQAGEMCNNPMHIARANRMISEVYVMMQKPKDAIQYVVKYLEISRKERDLKEEQRALATLARVHFINAEDLLPSKEREEALAHAQQYNIKSLKICDRLEGECSVSAKNIGEMRARVYLNLGLVEEALGNLEKAIQYLGKAVLVCKTLDLWEELCLSYTNLGLTHKHNADFASALKAFDLGLTVACRLSEKGKYMSDLYVQKALVLLELPDFRRAKHSLHKAYKLKTSAPSEQAEIGKKLKIVAAMSEYEEKLIHLPENSVFERRKIYESMGDGCAALESYRKALVYYHSSLECSEKLNESGKKASEILVSLAQTYKDLKDYDKAVQYYNRELTVWKDNPAEACNTSLSIAEVLELKNASSREILTIYRSALCLARDAKSLKLERIVLKNMLTHLNENMNSVMASEIEKELKKVERHFENQSDSESNSESEDTPAIGDHISLDALSDSEADEDEAKLKARTARRVRSCFQLRRNEKGETPLHVACINGNLSHVSKLLDQGHPVDVRDNNGWTPLHEAANYGYVEIVRELIDRGASINDPGGPHCDGVTPLLDAASCGHFLVMNLLLEKGASPIVRTDKGETVLDCLRNWRRRYIEEEHSDLTGETLNDYKTIAGKIKLAIEKTGHHVSHEKISDSLSRSRSSSRTDHFESRSSKSSKPSRNLSPILSSKAMRRKSSERRSLSRSPIRTEYPSSTSDKSAVSEYQSAIRGLKYRSTVNSEVPVSPIKVSQGALVDAENVVDDWLIDDMKEPTTLRPSKRRRRDDLISGIQLRNPSHKAKFENHNPSNASTVESMVEYSDDEICDSNDIKHRPEDCSSKDDIVNDSSTVRSDLENLKGDNVFPNNIYEATPCNQYGTQSTNNLSCSQKRQSTLHKAALTREPVQTADSVPITTEVYQKRHIIKVGIEGKTFLVPLPNDPDLTISWLAEETARRYHSMEGAEPKLDLKTVEGALLYPQDPLSLLRDVGSEVNAVVTAWNLASIAERYTDTCVANNLEVLSEVKAALDTAQSTSCLDLGESVLSKDELLPVFKAISHQNSLRYLRLNGNLLEDSGLKVLLESLVHMSQLRELSLRCCSISQNGLSEMCQFILEKNVFKALQVIDMSYNFLGDDCLGQLCDVISKLPSLHTLRLQSNYLTTFKAKQDYFLVSHLRDKLDKVTASNKAAVDLMLSLLNLNPHQRKSAEDLLGHEFFGGSLPPANNLNKLMRRLDKSPPDVEVPSYLQEAFFCRNEKENICKSAEEPTVKQSVVDEETQTGDQIEVLNLSQNKIGRQSVQEILSKLNPDKIRSLNLAYCGESVALEVAIFLANRVPHNLEELDLSYCDVCDDEMEQLFQCLKVSPRLRKLTLQGNDRLSQSTVEKLTQLQLSHLNLAGVECKLLNIEHSIEALYYSMSGPIQGQLPAGSFWGPFGLFSNNLHSLLKELK